MAQPQNRNGPGKEATQFQPGQSGNPGGRPKGLASKVREMVPASQLAEWYYALWTRDETKLEELGVNLKDVTLAERNKAGEWLAERGYGRAPQYAPVADGDPLELDATSRAIVGAVDELVSAREKKAAKRASGQSLAGAGEAGAASA